MEGRPVHAENGIPQDEGRMFCEPPLIFLSIFLFTTHLRAFNCVWCVQSYDFFIPVGKKSTRGFVWVCLDQLFENSCISVICQWSRLTLPPPHFLSDRNLGLNTEDLTKQLPSLGRMLLKPQVRCLLQDILAWFEIER